MSLSDNLYINVVKTLSTTKTEVWNSILYLGSQKGLTLLISGSGSGSAYLAFKNPQEKFLLLRTYSLWYPAMALLAHCIAQAEVRSTSLSTGWAVSLFATALGGLGLNHLASQE